jgi:HK97 family phage prohead protease
MKYRLKGTILKAQNEKDVYEAWASVAVIDRDKEFILPSAFKGSIKQYLNSNPVMFYDHAWATWDSPSESTLPIGKVVKAKIDKEKGLKIWFVFSDLDFAQQVKYLVDEGILNTISIGFIGTEYERDPVKIAELLKDEGFKTKETPLALFVKVEILENSIVGIPSNREAEIIRSYDHKDKILCALKTLKTQKGKNSQSLTEKSEKKDEQKPDEIFRKNLINWEV